MELHISKLCSRETPVRSLKDLCMKSGEGQCLKVSFTWRVWWSVRGSSEAAATRGKKMTNSPRKKAFTIFPEPFFLNQHQKSPRPEGDQERAQRLTVSSDYQLQVAGVEERITVSSALKWGPLLGEGERGYIYIYGGLFSH